MADKANESIVVLSKQTIKRIISDVKDLMKSSLEDEGIYYHHDEDDILKGYALITGPKDSLYYGGSYLYTFTFPMDYPHSPPVAYYHTNDGETRFHPNMYKSGKVCLSILNTWRGEPWSGCQTIRSVLLTILSVFDDKPFLHEPGITESHSNFQLYHDIIFYKNLSFSCFLGNDNPQTKMNPQEKFNGFPLYLFHDEIKGIHSRVIDELLHMIIGKLDNTILKLILKNEEDVKNNNSPPYDCDQHNKEVYMGAYRISCCFNWYKLILKYRDTFNIEINNLVIDDSENNDEPRGNHFDSSIKQISEVCKQSKDK
jgi:ubiquitin-protein ligase